MREPRTVLFAGEDDEYLAPIRFVLSLSTHNIYFSSYSISTTHTCRSTLNALKKRSYDLLLIFEPFSEADLVMERAREISPNTKQIVISTNLHGLDSSIADKRLFCPTITEILSTVKSLSTKKRGPTPRVHGHKKVK